MGDELEERLLADISIILQEANPKRSRQPSQILDHLYLGDYSDADSLGMLSEMAITHVLNCAGAPSMATCLGGGQQPLGGATGCIKAYHAFDADDKEGYDILQHFNAARSFIDSARAGGGKVLVHCAQGVNRSAAICVAYLMVDQHMDLETAVRTVATVRGRILKNVSFQKQLVKFAQQQCNSCNGHAS